MAGFLNQQWLDENEQRTYPFDDRCTMVDDDGNLVPAELLTDVRLLFNKEYGNGAYITSIMVSDLLVTVTFAVVKDDPFLDEGDHSYTPTSYDLGILPIAVVQAPKRDALKGRTFFLDPLEDGVGGWVSFGEGVANNGIWSFSTPQQSSLHMRVFSAISVEGVQTIGPKNSTTVLDGLVKMVGKTGVVTSVETRDIYDGETLVEEEAKCLVISLDSEYPENFYLLAGPCGVRPDSENCGKEGITSVASVAPDENGNINLLLDGMVVAYPAKYIAGEGGTDQPIGLALNLQLDFSTVLNIEDLCEYKEPRINPDGSFPGEISGDCEEGEITLPPIGECYCQDWTNDPPLQLDIWWDPDPGDPMLSTYLLEFAGMGPNELYRIYSDPTQPPETQKRVYIHCGIGAWQLFEGDEIQTFWFGAMNEDCETLTDVEEEDQTYTVAMGPQMPIDEDNPPAAPSSGFTISQISPATPTLDWMGIYCRKHRRIYVLDSDPDHEIRLNLVSTNGVISHMRWVHYYQGTMIPSQSDDLEYYEPNPGPFWRSTLLWTDPQTQIEYEIYIQSLQTDQGALCD